MTIAVTNRLRARLLLSACAMVAPGVAHAQDIVVPNGTTRTSTVQIDGSDRLTIEQGGTLSVTSVRAVNFNGEPTGDGPVIDNAGTIEAVVNASGRAIDAQPTVNTASRNITIRNRATGIVRASDDAIRISQGTDVTAPSLIRVENAGQIVSIDGAGVSVVEIPGARLSVTNAAGASISGGRRGVTGIVGDVVNAGTITGGTEAIRFTGPGDSTVTLLAGSTTRATGDDPAANAVNFVGGGTHTLTIEVGATVGGTLQGSSTGGARDILNLGGSGSQVVNEVNGFEFLNVTSGSWGIDRAIELSGGATIARGATLRLIDNVFSGSLRGAIVNDGELVFARRGEITQDFVIGSEMIPRTAPISGTGIVRLTNADGIVAFTQKNSYSGATLIDAGTLRADGVDNLSAASAVTVAADAILDINGFDNRIANLSGAGRVATNRAGAGGTLTTGGGGDTEFSGLIAGLGGLTKVGGGTLTLSGANTATGLVQATEGGIALTGSLAGMAGASGSGTLSGTGSVAGVTTIGDGGTLAPGIGGVGSFTTGGLVLASGARLAFDLGAPGDLATSDRIQVNGDVTLDGTIDVTDIGGFGAGVYRLIDYGGALTDNGLAVGTLPAGTDPGLITVQTAILQQVNLVHATPTAPTLQFWDGGDASADGTIDGGDGVWSGSLTNWTNANGTANAVWANAFAVFQGSAGVVTLVDPVGFTGMQFMTDGYSIVSGGGSLSTSQPQTNMRVDPGVTATIAASIGGSGGLLKNDSGTLIVSGANDYGGATAIAGGTLRVLGGSAIPVASAVSIAAGATLDIAADQIVGSLAGAGDVLLSGGTLTTGGNGGTTDFAGAVSGSGGFTKAGGGVMTLSGISTHTGMTTASGGTLLIDGGIAGSASVAGGATIGGVGRIGGTLAVADGGSVMAGSNGVGTLTTGGLVLASGSRLAYDLGAPGDLSASDRIQVNGDLTLDGTIDVTDIGGFGDGVYRLIDYSGALTDNGLVVGALPDGFATGEAQVQVAVGNQVNLVVAGAVADVQFWDGVNLTANGAIDGGPGSWTNAATNWTSASGGRNSAWGGKFAVFQSAAGIVGVDDAILFSGMQFMTDGMVIAGGNGSLTTTTAATGLRVDPGLTATIAASIGGSGGLAKLDGGTLILAGINGYGGATAVTGGTLRVTATGALPGGTAVTIASGATLDIAANQQVGSLAGAGNLLVSGATLAAGGSNGNSLFSGVISGSGGFTKSGTGTLTLSGVSSHGGGTNVAAGTLSVTGTLASAVTVAAGARLTGTGRIGGLTVLGTVAPGGSIGTLNVGGPVTFAAGSTYQVEVSPTAADRITATGAVAIDGGTVAVMAGSGSYSPVSSYTILSGSSVTGRFDAVTSDMAFLVPFLTYSASDVGLRLVRNDLAFASIGQTPNQRAVAAAVEAPLSGALFDTVVGLDPTGARRGFDLLAGQLHADLLGIATNAAGQVRGLVLDRMHVPGEGFALWVHGEYGEAGSDGGVDNAEVEATRFDLGGGIEYGFANAKIGLTATHTTADVDLPELAASGEIETFGGAVYAGISFDRVHLRIGGGYAAHRLDSDRAVLIAAFTDRLNGRETGHTVQGFGEVAVDAYQSGNLTLQPFVGGAWARTTLNGTVETGGAAALTLDRAEHDMSFVTAGLRAAGTVGTGPIRFDAELAGRQVLEGDQAVRTVRFAETGSDFAVRGADMGDTALAGRLGFTVPFGSAVLGLQAHGTASQTSRDYGARAQLGFRF